MLYVWKTVSGVNTFHSFSRFFLKGGTAAGLEHYTTGGAQIFSTLSTKVCSVFVINVVYVRFRYTTRKRKTQQVLICRIASEINSDLPASSPLR